MKIIIYDLKSDRLAVCVDILYMTKHTQVYDSMMSQVALIQL